MSYLGHHPESGHTANGKWAEPGVPHKGWSCDAVTDLGEPLEICGMCETAEIRYVHSMSHPEYPDVLDVGCICAEHMEEDYVAPRQREGRLRKIAARRDAWEYREWKTSRKGNLYLNTEGFNLTVFQDGQKWLIRVTRRSSGNSQLSRLRYEIASDAKSCALIALLWAKENL